MMTFNKFSFLLIFFLSFAVFSCEDGRTAEEAIDDASEEMADDIRTETEELSAELTEARRSIDKRLEALENDLDSAGADARQEIQESIRELRDYGNDIDNRMDKLGRDVKNGWAEFKRETKSTLQKVEAEINEEIRE